MAIKVTYIDDNIDTALSRFLASNFGDDYDEYEFNCKNGYEDLLNADVVRQANIIIIDSRLFENSQVHDKKFTGEEFKIILKKVFPFVEVIVITQNDEIEHEQILSKFKERHNGESAEDYYGTRLMPLIENASKNIEAYRAISIKLTSNSDVDKALVDKITNSLNGISVYDELKSSDVDKLIIAFEELNKRFNG